MNEKISRLRSTFEGRVWCIIEMMRLSVYMIPHIVIEWLSQPFVTASKLSDVSQPFSFEFVDVCRICVYLTRV